MSKHKGPICKECGQEFYYDYIPERNNGTGYCWICWIDKEKPGLLSKKDKEKI